MADDFSELMQLAADLDQGGAAVSSNVRKAVQVTSNKIKKDARASAGGRRQIGHASGAINYDVSESSDGVEAEIGYDKNHGAGELGAVIEFGAPNFTPSHDLGNALLANEGDFVHGLEKAVDDALKAGDL